MLRGPLAHRELRRGCSRHREDVGMPPQAGTGRRGPQAEYGQGTQEEGTVYAPACKRADIPYQGRPLEAAHERGAEAEAKGPPEQAVERRRQGKAR